MAHVVCAVRVLSIPARGESDDGPDAADTEARGQGLGIWSRAVEVPVISRRRHAAVAHLGCRARGGCRGVPDKHAEAGCERGDIDRCIRRRDVIDRYAAIGG